MKLVLKILGILVALIFVAVVALLLFFDPNMFKPRIESVAREQGVALSIDGDLGWRLWPNFGVEVNGIRVAAVSAPDDQIAQLQRASLLLAVRPLFRGEVQVHHIIVEGAQIAIVIDEEGVGNWEALLPDDESEPTSPAPVAPADVEPQPVVVDADEEGTDFTLAVDRISLRDSALSYRDLGTGQEFSLRDLGFEINGFNLQGEAFDLVIGWLAEITDPELFGGQTLSIVGNLRGDLQMAADFNDMQLRDGDLTLNFSRGNESGRVQALFGASLANLQGDMSYQASFELPTFNPRQLLAVLDAEPLDTAEAYALTQVGLKLQVAGDAQQVRVEPLELQLDRTRIAGHFAVTDMDTMAMDIALMGDSINVDHYLPPPTDEKEVEAPEATGDEELIPLELIQSLALRVALDFEQITVAALPLQAISVRLEAKDGVVNLSRADAQLYEGRIVSTASLDGRADTARIRFDAAVEALQLAPLMSDMGLDDNIGLTGAINALAEGGTRGVTMNELMAALQAQANFSGGQVRVSPINVEELICKAINTVSRVDQPARAWDEFTEMRQLAGKVVVEGPEIRLESFDAGVQQLALGMSGKMNLDTSAYDFTLPLRLLNTTTGEHGCTVRSNYWIDRSLSLLRCRGSLEALNPLRDCRPDARGLESLTKDFAKEQLRSRYGDDIDAAEQRLRDTQQQAEEKKAELQRQADEKAAELRRQAEEKREEERKALEDRLRERLRR